jgi:hypothetical protein
MIWFFVTFLSGNISDTYAPRTLRGMPEGQFLEKVFKKKILKKIYLKIYNFIEQFLINLNNLRKFLYAFFAISYAFFINLYAFLQKTYAFLDNESPLSLIKFQYAGILIGCFILIFFHFFKI